MLRSAGDVYDPKTYAYIGQVVDNTGKSLVYASLWDLVTGGTKVTGSAAVRAGDPSTMYFVAGLDKKAHGLFCAIGNTATGGASVFGFTTADTALTVKAGSAVNTAISIAPVNGFSGILTLSCKGLPVGATCTFTPSQVTVSATAASSTVTIQTTSTMGRFVLIPMVDQVLASRWLCSSPLRRSSAGGGSGWERRCCVHFG